jgi:hypothetical protein
MNEDVQRYQLTGTGELEPHSAGGWVKWTDCRDMIRDNDRLAEAILAVSKVLHEIVTRREI